MFFGLIKTRRIFRKITILFIAVFAGLNWFARLPYSTQSRLYNLLPDSLTYKIYYLSNTSASITDFIGLTGSDCSVEFKGKLPVDGVVCGGMPRGVPNDVQYFKRTGFTVCYSPELRHPVWVALKIHDDQRSQQTSRPSFKKDFRAKNSPNPDDYYKSGYDRGHMAPNRGITTCYGRKAQKETFLLSNICPQKAGLNRGPWRRMEYMIADIWPEKYGDIYVLTGAHSTGNRKKLPSGINIPAGFYKIALAQHNNRLYAMAIYMKQETGFGAFPRTKTVSIDKIEQMTGLDFLSALPDDIEEQLESGTATRLWPANASGNIKLLSAYFKPYY
ncbi:MAG: DNA/RNA non-specific endonuclease [Kiritimatiellia bacterium]